MADGSLSKKHDLFVRIQQRAAEGRKKIHYGEIVLETPTFIIRFWGRQLDEAQADLWMQLMYEASKAPLGEPVIINRAALLRAIGRSTGKPMYEWLHRA